MGWIILAIVVILVIAVISMYNDLVSRRVKVDNAWSQIDVQLQRRFDLIPNNRIKNIMGKCSNSYRKSRIRQSIIRCIKNNNGCF